jgi:hypothetical protein|nr:MAG TPA: hypothetical protein [Caudoviricetes sp.]
MELNEVKELKEVFLETAATLEEVEIAIQRELNGDEVDEKEYEALMGKFLFQCMKISRITN